MNILIIADSIVGLFPRKIKVTLIHDSDGIKIGEYKIAKEQLPETFNKPTILKIAGQSWRVTKAIENRKNLVLHVQLEDHFSIGDRFLVPSIVFQLPEANIFSLFEDFTLSLSMNDWRQLEFLPVGELPLVQQEIENIELILSTYESADALLGYEVQHVRGKVKEYYLGIPFDEFCTFVNSNERGNISLIKDQIVKNGFSLRSDNYIYYGIVQDNRIKNLSLQQFDCTDDELSNVLYRFDLILVDWCNARIFGSES